MLDIPTKTTAREKPIFEETDVGNINKTSIVKLIYKCFV
jgi:hypothetical protein